MDTTFSTINYPSPMQYYSAPDGTSWLHCKAPETRGLQKSSFSIDAILSRGAPEPGLQRMKTPHDSTHPVAPAIPMWPRSGYSTSNTPYPHYYVGYQSRDPHNEILYNNGYIGSPGKLVSRRNYVRRTCRRIRTIFTDEQLRRLEEVFSKQRYMTGTEKVLLASALQLSETQVKVWFQNRRTRWRKTQEGDRAASSPEGNQINPGSPQREEDAFISVDEEDSWSP